MKTEGRNLLGAGSSPSVLLLTKPHFNWQAYVSQAKTALRPLDASYQKYQEAPAFMLSLQALKSGALEPSARLGEFLHYGFGFTAYIEHLPPLLTGVKLWRTEHFLYALGSLRSWVDCLLDASEYLNVFGELYLYLRDEGINSLYPKLRPSGDMFPCRFKMLS